MKRDLVFRDDPLHTHTIQYRNPLDAIKSLLGDAALAKDIVYQPHKVFTNANRDDRIYNEVWTGQWWHAVQVCDAHFSDLSFTDHFYRVNFQRGQQSPL